MLCPSGLATSQLVPSRTLVMQHDESGGWVRVRARRFVRSVLGFCVLDLAWSLDIF